MTIAAGTDAPVAEALTALRSLREATERALLCLERDDPDGAVAALGDGSRASASLDALYARWPGGAPMAAHGDLAREADAVLVLQALASEKGAAGRDRAALELERLGEGRRLVRGYRPHDDASPSLDTEG